MVLLVAVPYKFKQPVVLTLAGLCLLTEMSWPSKIRNGQQASLDSSFRNEKTRLARRGRVAEIDCRVAERIADGGCEIPHSRNREQRNHDDQQAVFHQVLTFLFLPKPLQQFHLHLPFRFRMPEHRNRRSANRRTLFPCRLREAGRRKPASKPHSTLLQNPDPIS